MKRSKKNDLRRKSSDKLIKYLLLIESMLSDGMDPKAKESALRQYDQILAELEKRGIKKENLKKRYCFCSSIIPYLR